MAAVTKIDSNATGLRIAEEDSLETVSGDEIWVPYSVIGYGDFGGENTTESSDPIADHYQSEKGVVVDREARANFQLEFKYEQTQPLLQGFFFADLNTNVELAVATVDGTGNDYEPASGGGGYAAGDLLFAKDFGDDANNGLKVVTGVPAAASVPVTTSLTTAAGQTGTISKVGVELTSADCSVDVSGTWPKYVVSTYDWTGLGVEAGDLIYVGGDDTADQFANAVNNGFKRVRSVSATELVVDKSNNDMVIDAGTGKTIRIFSARYLKNQALPTNQIRRSYQVERNLGAPDDASPAQIQYEHVIGSVAGELTLNMPNAAKVTMDLSFLGTQHTFIDGPTSAKGGTRPTLSSEDIFDTSNNVVLNQLTSVTSGDEAPTPLFAFIEELTLNINNNLSLLKAIGTVGGFEITRGKFKVSGSMTAYLGDISAMQAVQNNNDVSLMNASYQNNQGWAFDIPVMMLGDGRAGVAPDEPVKVPISFEAGRGTKVFSGYDHTLLMAFFDYLPALAGTNP